MTRMHDRAAGIDPKPPEPPTTTPPVEEPADAPPAREEPDDGDSDSGAPGTPPMIA